jgi:drug/metabolite transporter (DMT)-like permease
MHPRKSLLYGALLLHSLLSAGTYILAKRALTEIPPLALGLLRFGGASLMLTLLLLKLRPKGSRLPRRDQWRKLLLLSFVAVPLNQGFFLYGLSMSTAAHAALLYTLTPLFVLLLAQALLGELPGFRTSLGTALALAGTIWVLFARGLDLSRGPLVGDLLLVVAVLAWAFYTAEGREIVAQDGALPTIAWTLIGGTLLFLPVGLGSLLMPETRAQLAHASREAWLGVVYLSVMTSVVSYLIWYWALGHLTAARVAVFSNLQPLGTALLAHFFLGESITVSFLLGAAVVIAGVLIAQLRTRPPAPALVPPVQLAAGADGPPVRRKPAI